MILLVLFTRRLFDLSQQFLTERTEPRTLRATKANGKRTRARLPEVGLTLDLWRKCGTWKEKKQKRRERPGESED